MINLGYKLPIDLGLKTSFNKKPLIPDEKSGANPATLGCRIRKKSTIMKAMRCWIRAQLQILKEVRRDGEIERWIREGHRLTGHSDLASRQLGGIVHGRSISKA